MSSKSAWVIATFGFTLGASGNMLWSMTIRPKCAIRAVACLLGLVTALILSGCLTSQEPFYQKGDIVVDDRLVGLYRDEPDQTGARYHVVKLEETEHKGFYAIRVVSTPGCQMKFLGVLFKIGTNEFLDMLPRLEACDYIPANPPSLLELLQSATLQPMHMAMRVDVSTNGLRLGMPDLPTLQTLARTHHQYFQPTKPDEFPRMVPDTAWQREFLLRFGGDTNIFKPGLVVREVGQAK